MPISNQEDVQAVTKKLSFAIYRGILLSVKWIHYTQSNKYTLPS